MTRPDISYVVQTLSLFVHALKKYHIDATLRVVCYIKGIPRQGLLFLASSKLDSISFYSDSDWATCAVTRRSVSEYCIKLVLQIEIIQHMKFFYLRNKSHTIYVSYCKHFLS